MTPPESPVPVGEPSRPPSREELAEMIARGDAAGAARVFQGLDPGDTARAILELDGEDQGRLLTLLKPATAAEVLRDVGDEQAADVIEDLPAKAAAAIVDQLPSDEQADLLGEMPARAARAILREMQPAEAGEASQLMRYAPDTAGGLMAKEYLAYPAERTMGEVVEDLHAHRDRYADYDVQYVYVTDEAGRLAGVMRMRDILFSPAARTLGETMVPNPARVLDDESIPRLRAFFEDHHLLGVPVVDAEGRLLGVVQPEDVEEALARETRRQFLRISGIISGEESRTMPLHLRSGRRMVWLTLNIFFNFVPAGVVALYQGTIQSAVVLAVFLPIISNMAGCSGHQAVAVSIRELALGLIRPREFRRVLLKESSLGALVGLGLGVILAGVTFLWKGNVYLSLVVGVALAANTVVSVCVGGLLPLVLRRLRVDPALLSGPVLTAITDACGFLLVLSLAVAVLPKLA